MDFEPVPAGTAAPAALQLRGADHDLDFAAGDSVEVALGGSLHHATGAPFGLVLVQVTCSTSRVARWSLAGPRRMRGPIKFKDVGIERLSLLRTH